MKLNGLSQLYGETFTIIIDENFENKIGGKICKLNWRSLLTPVVDVQIQNKWFSLSVFFAILSRTSELDSCLYFLVFSHARKMTFMNQ